MTAFTLSLAGENDCCWLSPWSQVLTLVAVVVCTSFSLSNVQSGLSELSETLSLSTEEVLMVSGFSVDRFVPAVVALIRFPSTMEVLLLAARALSSIMELFPSTAIPKAISEQIVPSLCEKLMEIEYMDVAELALQILERIVCKSEAALALANSSTTSPAELGAQYRAAVIKENGIVALLQFVDFFPLEIQRTASRVVCQLCTEFPVALADKLQLGLPLISNLMNSFDGEILQSSCEAFRKLSESRAFAESPQFAMMIASDETCESLVRKLAAYGNPGEAGDGASELTPAGYTSILRFMSCVLSCIGSDVDTCAASQSAASLRFVRLPPIVSALLAREEVMGENQLLRETLKLVIAVLPISEEVQSVDTLPRPMQSFAHEILPLVTRVYDATSRSDLRYDCLGVIYRSCSIIFAKRAPLSTEEQVELTRLAAFLTRVLRPKRRKMNGPVQAAFGRDADVLPIRLALQIVEVTLGRDESRDLMKAMYIRHGVPNAIRYYASLKKMKVQDDDEHQTEIESNVASISATASQLVQDYLDGESSDPDAVVQLREIADNLRELFPRDTNPKRTLDVPSKSLRSVFHKLTSLFASTAGGLTAHEIAQSGLVRALICSLSSSKGKAEFMRAISDESDGHEPSEQCVGFIAPLVQCLQDAISSEKDAFSLEVSPDSPSSTTSSFSFASGNVSSDLDQLAQHIKVRVLIEDEKEGGDGNRGNAEAENNRGDGLPTPWSFRNSLRRATSRSGAGGMGQRLNRRGVHDTVVLVEPLARVETIEEFITEKLFGTQSSSASMLDELAGRNRSDDEDDEEKEDDEDELTEQPKERRVEAIYNGQVLPRDISILEAVVKFGVLARSSDTSDEGPSPEDSSRSSSLRRHIWTVSPHDISFRVVQPVPSTKDSKPSQVDEASPDEVVAPSDGASSSAVDGSSVSPLEAQAASLDDLWWDGVWDLLQLLKLIRDCVGPLNRDEPSMSSSPPLLLLDSNMFVNSFLSLQVNRALMQPVRVVTNALPEWSFRMVHEFSFALDFETRYHFMYVTMCGTSRAIQYLCRTVWKRAVMEEPAVSQTSGGSSSRRRTRDGAGTARSRTAALTNISRMVKLPRLKVRVARSRLLQSAKKLLAIYGGKKAVIEIEFLGEVGTGLGPTTEFFTLVCEEIQSKRLMMWRDDDPADQAAAANDADKEAEKRSSGEAAAARASLPVRGYHRIAVYHCQHCKRIRVPSCAIHNQLLTHEKKVDGGTRGDEGAIGTTDAPSPSNAQSQPGDNVGGKASPAASRSVPQCASCLDDHDWSAAASSCECKENATATLLAGAATLNSEDSSSPAGSTPSSPSSSSNDEAHTSQLKWWILSDDEVQYLGKVFPRGIDKITHPVLQCAHCETVNFPGTDAGIVEMDGERMIARSGRRMYERDYRAVTKHVSPLCEGTPLKVLPSVLTRGDVESLVVAVPRCPEVLESEVESLNYLTESSLLSNEIGGGPAVSAPFGLFPRPYFHPDAVDDASSSAEEESKPAVAGEHKRVGEAATFEDVTAWFTFLGRFVGQALLDERLLNLPLSRPFLRALRGESLVGDGVSVDTSLAFLSELDPTIATSLRYLYRLAKLKEGAGDASEKAAEVDSMCLSFTLVGEETIPLVPGGADVSVTLDSLLEYVTLNLRFLLDTTIRRQVQAFRRGFEQICGKRGDASGSCATMLEVFDVRELETLCADARAVGSMWDREGHELREHMVCDHGYTRESRAIADLVAILCELSVDEQRAFVRFVTGANRLPRGGLAKLEPKLTVVRKLAESHSAGSENDAVLPSASTCTNYLKLPEYSTRAVMKERLLYCIREGQGSFHLS